MHHYATLYVRFSRFTLIVLSGQRITVDQKVGYSGTTIDIPGVKVLEIAFCVCNT